MKLISFFSSRRNFFKTCMFLLFYTYPTFGEVNPEEIELISVIAERNRANQHILNSFYLESTTIARFWSDNPPNARMGTINSKEGYIEHEYQDCYAFSDERLYRKSDNLTLDEHMSYVRNGTSQRSAIQIGESPRSISLGTKGKEDTELTENPNPWNQHNLSLALNIDKLNPKYDRIATCETTEIDGKEVVIVTIEQRLATDPENQYDHIVKLYFSVEDGFMPIRMRQGRIESSKEPFIIDVKVPKILKYQVQGSTLYLPGEIIAENHRGGKPIRSWHYKVNEKSVKTNPELPDELFKIEIRPDDIVVDRVLDMQLANALDLDLITPEALTTLGDEPDLSSEKEDNSKKVPVRDNEITTEELNQPEIVKTPKILLDTNKNKWLWLGKILLLCIGILSLIFGVKFLRTRQP